MGHLKQTFYFITGWDVKVTKHYRKMRQNRIAYFSYLGEEQETKTLIVFYCSACALFHGRIFYTKLLNRNNDEVYMPCVKLGDVAEERIMVFKEYEKLKRGYWMRKRENLDKKLKTFMTNNMRS